jgi:hypothetical protein
MTTVERLSTAIVIATLNCSAHAESLRCNGHSTNVGDSRLTVLRICGEPTLKDSYCAPVYVGPNLQLVPQPFAGSGFPVFRLTNGYTTVAPVN